MTYDELEELKSKKKAMERNRDALVKSADEFPDKAESISMFSKSNALRRAGTEKDNEIVAINVSLPSVSVHYLQFLQLLICREVYIT